MNKNFESCTKVVCGKQIVNTTPHPINFDVDGEIVVVPCSPEALLNAKAVEESVGDDLVRTNFVGTQEGRDLISDIKIWCANNGCLPVRIVGSIIAAQAYPGDVVAMTPAPGFERVPPQEKRMNPNKFTTFQK